MGVVSVNHDAVAEVAKELRRAVEKVSTVVRGKENVIELCLIGILSRGHILLEDVPGLGKTSLARSLAKVVGGDFSRLQLTADLLPVDIIGGQVLDSTKGVLSFRRGPIFANVVLADELNRATPRTQSGLLEAMAERAVSIDGTTYRLPSTFFVIATQNPVDHHGTYPLPQSQMDRFLLRTALGYPDTSIEVELLTGERQTEDALGEVLNPGALTEYWQLIDNVVFSPEVAKYLHAIVLATRNHVELQTGVSTRGLLQFGQAVRARALLKGRNFVSPDDVYALAVPVCAHRVVVRGTDRPAREDAEAIMTQLLERTQTPD